jgi:hypothetical protein
MALSHTTFGGMTSMLKDGTHAKKSFKPCLTPYCVKFFFISLCASTFYWLGLLLGGWYGEVLASYPSRPPLFSRIKENRQNCFIGWGCFLEGGMVKSWLLIQAAHLRSQGSRKTAKTWATGLVRQLWKVAFKMRQHWNTWQHDKLNPENCGQHAELDQQVVAAWSQGTASVLKEHTHLFTLPLAYRQKHTLTEKVDWLEFVSLAQRRARASLRRQHKT